MGLSIFEETFGTERVRYGKVSKREATTEHLAAITEAVQKVVDTFRDPNTGQRYIVSLSPNTEAYTEPNTKRIVVSYKPIFDKGLKVSTVCTVMTGLTFHEIGHTLYTFPNSPAFAAAFGEPGSWTGWSEPGGRKKKWDQLAYTMLNIGDDARLEARMVENLPVAASVFPTMLHWVAITAGMVDQPFKWTGKAMPMPDRVNFAGRAVRYPWTARWSSDTNTRAERVWWVNWGAEYIALDDHDAEGMVALIKVALDRLRNPADLGFTPEPKPPVITCGPTGPGGQQGTEDEDEDDEPKTEPGKGKGKEPFGDDFDKDPDADGDESDEDGDEDEDGDDDWDEDEDGDDDGEDADDDPTHGNSEVDDDDDEPDEGESNTGDTKDGDTNTESDKDEAEKVGEDEPKEGEFKQDFDAHDLQGNVDTVNHPEDWQAQNTGTLTQKLLDSEQLTERVNTGQWGTAKVEMRSMDQFISRR